MTLLEQLAEEYFPGRKTRLRRSVVEEADFDETFFEIEGDPMDDDDSWEPGPMQAYFLNILNNN